MINQNIINSSYFNDFHRKSRRNQLPKRRLPVRNTWINRWKKLTHLGRNKPILRSPTKISAASFSTRWTRGKTNRSKSRRRASEMRRGFETRNHAKPQVKRSETLEYGEANQEWGASEDTLNRLPSREIVPWWTYFSCSYSNSLAAVVVNIRFFPSTPLTLFENSTSWCFWVKAKTQFVAGGSNFLL